MWVTNDLDAGARYFTDTVITRYKQAAPHVTITPEAWGNAGTQRTKYLAQIAAGDPPDWLHFDFERVPALAAKGGLAELTTYLKRDSKVGQNIAMFDVWKRYTKDRYFMLPGSITTSVLVVVQDAFRRKNVPIPTGDMSWNPRDGGPFVEMARRLTSEANGEWGHWWTGQITSDTLSWLHQNGGSWLTKDMTKADLLKPESREAFQFMYDLVHKYRVSPKPQDAPMLDAARGLRRHWLALTGKAATFNLQAGQESDWDPQQAASAQVVAVPLPRGKVRAAGAHMRPFVLGPGKVVDEAWAALAWWMLDLESQVGVATQLGDGIPPSRLAWQDKRITSRQKPPQDVRPFIEPLEKGYASFHEISTVWTEWTGPFNQEWNAAMRGEKSVNDALQAAQRAIQVELDKAPPA
jgi:ABC-type glycerol-3-phosphate transport system substrate-binding protein